MNASYDEGVEMVWIVIEEGSDSGDEWAAIVGVGRTPESAEKVADSRGLICDPWIEDGRADGRSRVGHMGNGKTLTQHIQGWGVE